MLLIDTTVGVTTSTKSYTNDTFTAYVDCAQTCAGMGLLGCVHFEYDVVAKVCHFKVPPLLGLPIPVPRANLLSGNRGCGECVST